MEGKVCVEEVLHMCGPMFGIPRELPALSTKPQHGPLFRLHATQLRFSSSSENFCLHGSPIQSIELSCISCSTAPYILLGFGATFSEQRVQQELLNEIPFEKSSLRLSLECFKYTVRVVLLYKFRNFTCQLRSCTSHMKATFITYILHLETKLGQSILKLQVFQSENISRSPFPQYKLLVKIMKKHERGR